MIGWCVLRKGIYRIRSFAETLMKQVVRREIIVQDKLQRTNFMPQSKLYDKSLSIYRYAHLDLRSFANFESYAITVGFWESTFFHNRS